MREPDDRATRLESLKLLEGRRASYDVAMWQVPTLTVLSQTFLLTILSDHSVRYRVALWAAIAGWVTLGMVAFALWQLRDRELHFSGRINTLAASLGMERPTRRRRRRRWWRRPLEWRAWPLWSAVFAAFAVADFVALCSAHHPGCAADVAGFLRKHGHSQVDFTVVGSGPNGANPHHEMGDRVIEEGDMVVLDFGGLKDGYGSDTTRTVHVGEPTDEEREVFEIVRRAQQAGFEAVRPGVACQEVDRAARKVIADAGYGEYFIHRVGPGIGLTTHEPPYMIEGEERLMEPGMCFSIEPGIYLPDRFGVRIEDIVTVTEDGGRRLNNTNREMRIVS